MNFFDDINMFDVTQLFSTLKLSIHQSKVHCQLDSLADQSGYVEDRCLAKLNFWRQPAKILEDIKSLKNGFAFPDEAYFIFSSDNSSSWLRFL